MVAGGIGKAHGLSAGMLAFLSSLFLARNLSFYVPRGKWRQVLPCASMDLGLVFPPCLFQSAWAFWHVSSMGLWCDELAFISLLTYPSLPFQSCAPGFVCFLFSYRGAIPHAPSSPFSFFVLLSLYFFKNVSSCLVILEEKERNPCFILPCLIVGPGPIQSSFVFTEGT